MYDLFLTPSVEQLGSTMEARQGLQNRGRNVILKRLTIAHSSRNFIRSIEAHRGKGNSSNKPVSILLACISNFIA